MVTTQTHLLASREPPEPARTLTTHLLRATAQVALLPRWAERHSIAALSPSMRQLAWKVARTYTQNPDHGFAIAELVPAQAVGSLWPLYEAASCLREVHEAYAQLSGLLLDNMSPSVREESAECTLVHLPDAGLALDRAEEDFRAAMQVKTWRALLRRPKLAPTSVSFTYARPKHTREHERQLGSARLRFSQPAFTISLARHLWERPLPTADSELFARHYSQLCEQLRAHENMALERRVEALAAVRLSRDASASAIAEALGMSVRTLRRKLAQRGQSFRTLLERARARERELLDEAEQLVRGTATATVRARLLGFASPGALRNALRRVRA